MQKWKGNLSRFFLKLKNIEKNIENGARLTSQLLGYARKGKYEARRLGLNQIVGDSAETFGRTRVKPGKGIILLVDDEEIIINVSVEMLKKLGYRVLKAISGKEAIQNIKPTALRLTWSSWI